MKTERLLYISTVSDQK